MFWAVLPYLITTDFTHTRRRRSATTVKSFGYRKQNQQSTSRVIIFRARLLISTHVVATHPIPQLYHTSTFFLLPERRNSAHPRGRNSLAFPYPHRPLYPPYPHLLLQQKSKEKGNRPCVSSSHSDATIKPRRTPKSRIDKD